MTANVKRTVNATTLTQGDRGKRGPVGKRPESFGVVRDIRNSLMGGLSDRLTAPISPYFTRGVCCLRDILDERIATKNRRCHTENVLRSGVAIYRDRFRIRPYGDSDNDWMTLDTRRVQKPTLRIGHNQVSGLLLVDKLIAGRLCSIAPQFTPNLLQRLAAYLGRIGQPDLDIEILMK